MSSLRSNGNLLVLLPNLTSGNLLQILNYCVSYEQEPVKPDYQRFDGSMMLLYILKSITIQQALNRIHVASPGYFKLIDVPMENYDSYKEFKIVCKTFSDAWFRLSGIYDNLILWFKIYHCIYLKLKIKGKPGRTDD